MADVAETSGKRGKQRNLRQKPKEESNEDGPGPSGRTDEDEAEYKRARMEELKLLQKMRKKASGTNATTLALGANDESNLASDEPDMPTELMGAFSRAKAVVHADEDPHMQQFVEKELARRLGKDVNSLDNEDPETRRKRLELEMYQIPEQYKTDLQGDFTVPGMTAIITEVNLSAAVRLQNIEANEAKKRQLLGDDDGLSATKEAKMKRNTCVPSFGRQPVRDKSRTREEMEADAKRMRFMSERRPALPAAKLSKR